MWVDEWICWGRLRLGLGLDWHQDLHTGDIGWFPQYQKSFLKIKIYTPTQTRLTGISFSHQDLHTGVWDVGWFPQFNIRNLFLKSFYSEVGLRVELTSIRLSHQDLHTGAWDICWFLQSNIGNLFPLFKSALLGSWSQTKIDKHQPFTSILAMHTGLVGGPPLMLVHSMFKIFFEVLLRGFAWFKLQINKVIKISPNPKL